MKFSNSLYELQVLLDKVGIIDFQYKKTRQKTDFNIFNLLSKKFDEVNLHSKLIYELLNPKASHQLGQIFLRKLLEQLQVYDFEIEEASVYKEYKNIDLLIRNRRQALIIENKLWAVDQPGQLQRYYEILRAEGYADIKLFYLSIDGKEPEDHSIGNLCNLPDRNAILYSISYETDIDQWLELCIKEVYDYPTLRETLIQYRSLIRDISGKTMNKEEMHDIVEFLAKETNVLKAKKIAENWNHVKWFTEWYFWTDLEQTVNNEFNVLELQKYSDPKLSSVIHHSRNRNPWYGIMFKIGEYAGADACIFIERGMDNVYYGLTMVINNTKRHNKEPQFAALAMKVAEFSEWGMEESWIGGNYCEPKINFNSFSNETTLQLLNDNFRAQYIASLWPLIKSFILQVQPLLSDGANT
jgi:hypothetical protein